MSEPHSLGPLEPGEAVGVTLLQVCRRAESREMEAWGESKWHISFTVLTKTHSFFFGPRSKRCLHWKLGTADCLSQWDRVLR